MTVTILTATVIALSAAGAVFYLIRQRKKGGCGGCSGCTACGKDGGTDICCLNQSRETAKRNPQVDKNKTG